MSVLVRAWKSILRQPAKSIILLLTIAILGTLIAGAVSIKQGIVASQKAMAGKIKIYASIAPKNMNGSESLSIKELTQIPALSGDMIEKITALPQVKSYETTRFVTFSSDNLVSDSLGAGTSRDASFKVIAAQNGKLLDYASGDITLVKGRWLTPEDETSPLNPVVISDAVAQKNRLSVGSQITLSTTVLASRSFGESTPDQDYLKATETTFTIIGTYGAADKYVTGPGGQLQSVTGYINMYMYTTGHTLEPVLAATVEKAISKSAASAQTEGNNSSYFYLRNRYAPSGFSAVSSFNLWLYDRAGAERFADEVAAIGLPTQYEITVSTEAYDQTMSPLSNLSWIVDLIVIASMAVTVIILGLIIMMILRTRKTEIGTLFSLGERKTRIAVQVLAEVLLVAAIGLSVSVWAGGKLTEGISGQMVKGEVAKLLETQPNGSTTLDGTALLSMSKGGGSAAGIETVALIYGIGLLTAGLSTAFPVILTLRHPPKLILS